MITRPLAAVRNFLTFDIEEWYRVNYCLPSGTVLECPPEWTERFTGRLIDMCGQAHVRCTFFVLGSVARSCPNLVKRIAAEGHEVASHGYEHRAVSQMTQEEFDEDLRRSCGELESLTGTAVRGFRAPSFSVTSECLGWYYEALERRGLTYSSSVFPGKTFLYGIADFPRHAHRPMVEGRRSSIVEFPATRVDIAGQTMGLYPRLFPAPMLRSIMRRENQAGRHAMIYVHPREIDPEQPRLPLSRAQSFIHYLGVPGCERKLRSLLERSPGTFGRLIDAVEHVG